MTGRITGGVFSFTCNKFWSFNAKGSRRLTIEARRFLALYAVSYVTSVSTFYVLTKSFGVDPVIAKAISDTAIFFFNFVVMRLYVFHQRLGVSARISGLFRDRRTPN